AIRREASECHEHVAHAFRIVLRVAQRTIGGPAGIRTDHDRVALLRECRSAHDRERRENHQPEDNERTHHKKFPVRDGASSYHRERNPPPMKIAAAGILAFSALTTACVNSSTLQTAKALSPGHQRVLVGGGFYSSPDIN